MTLTSVPSPQDEVINTGMAGRTLLILGSTGPSKHGLFEAARKHGLRLLLVKNKAGWEREYADYVLSLDCSNYDDFQPAVQRISEFASKHKAEGAITTSDAAIPALAEVTAALGLVGPTPDLAAILRDKVLMRERFAQLGLPSAASVAVRHIGQAIAAAAEIGYPVIVKPALGTGSLGVLLARDATEVAAACSTALSLGSETESSVLIEEFLDGREVIVDAVTENGDILFHNIVDNPQDLSGPTFEQLEFVTPTSLPTELAEQVYEVNKRTVLALGLTSAVTHTQMKVTSRGPRLIEIHPRVAGARVPEITSAALGVDLYDAAVHLAMGIRPPISQRHGGYAGYHCVYPHRSGLLTRIHGLTEAAEVPGVDDVEIALPPPRSVEKLPSTTQQNIGFVYASASGYEQVRERMATALRRIVLDIS